MLAQAYEEKSHNICTSVCMGELGGVRVYVSPNRIQKLCLNCVDSVFECFIINILVFGRSAVSVDDSLATLRHASDSRQTHCCESADGANLLFAELSGVFGPTHLCVSVMRVARLLGINSTSICKTLAPNQVCHSKS